jgi:putative SOS response-associated peptidase YedK
VCGRFVQTIDLQKLARELDIPVELLGAFAPRYNVAPSQPVAVLYKDREIHCDAMRWGLIPSWSKDPAIGNRMINARAETLAEKPSFRGPLERSRCLIPADGYYEWKQEGNRKQPYYIHLKAQEPFTFAGLYSRWISPDGNTIRTFTIVTTEANEMIRPIHHRMPVILPRRRREVWLDKTNFDLNTLLPLLQPCEESALETYRISTSVNRPTNDGPACIQPLG